jgi:hypothetical protein
VLYFCVVGEPACAAARSAAAHSGQVEAPDLEVDVADRAELARTVDVGLDVDGRQAVWEAPGFCGAVVLLDVATRAGNGQVVQQGEVVEAQHFHQQRGVFSSSGSSASG